MGHPRPVSKRKAPVRLAMRRGTCCLHASTASTANSGSVCSHARMASANPCAMKNCADSAAHAMSMAAARMDGTVQKTEDGFACGIIPADSTMRAQTGAMACRRLSACGLLSESDVRILLDELG